MQTSARPPETVIVAYDKLLINNVLLIMYSNKDVV